MFILWIIILNVLAFDIQSNFLTLKRHHRNYTCVRKTLYSFLIAVGYNHTTYAWKNLEIMTFLSSYDKAFCLWSDAVEKIVKEYKNIPKSVFWKVLYNGPSNNWFWFPTYLRSKFVPHLSSRVHVSALSSRYRSLLLSYGVYFISTTKSLLGIVLT